MNVILTNVESPQVISMINSFGKKNIDVICLSSDQSAPGFYSTYSSANHLHNPIIYKNYKPTERSTKNFIKLISLVTKKWSPSILIPNSESTLIPLSARRDEIDAIMPIPSHESIETVYKKWLTITFCNDHNIKVPRSFMPNPSRLVDKPNLIKFPAIIKEAISFGGGKFFICNDLNELKMKYNQFISQGKLPMIQEYVDGPEYNCIFAVDKNSKIIGSLISEFHLADSDTSSFSINKSNRNIERISAKILKKLGWHGLVSIQFVLKNGDPCLIEINPRLGASMELAIRSGIDLPYILYCDILKKPLKRSPSKKNLIFIYWHNGILYQIKKYGLNHFLKLLYKDKIVLRTFFPNDPLPSASMLFKFLKESVNYRLFMKNHKIIRQQP